MLKNENRRTNDVRTREKPITAVQSSDIQSLEELDQKVEESYSKDSNGLFSCHHCGKSTVRKSNIKEHVETHFEGLEFPCTLCDTILRKRNSLRHHIKRQHYS